VSPSPEAAALDKATTPSGGCNKLLALARALRTLMADGFQRHEAALRRDH
jgi:hypothetical protein